jgi:hypothetical protein
MMLENLVLPPQTDETLELLELHRRLTAFDGLAFAQEQDSYSLAQPSPFRFVPLGASNGAAPLIQGE